MMKSKRGITLIALVVTIIVLLILAGISISMLTGQNGILNRAGEARETTGLAQAQETVAMVCTELMINTYAENSETNIKKVAEELQKQGYTVEYRYPFGTQIIGACLKEGNTVFVGKNETANANVELITSNGKSKGYYMLVDKEYYEIQNDEKGNIKLANTPTKISDSLEDDTIELAYINTSYATATINDEEITLTGVAKGTTNLKLTVNGTEYTVGNITVKELKNLASINITNMILDGASLITATLDDDTIATSDDVIWTSSNNEVATVASNGIVKCGSKTGTAEISCKGAGNVAPLKCTVTNTASKIVYTNSESANGTINGSLADKAYNQPTIPVGFSAIDTIDAKWNKDGTAQKQYNNGLVIMDEKGNQFVWVPISADVYDADNDGEYYEKWCTTGTSHSNCSDDTLSDGTTTIATVDTSKTYGGFWIGRYEAGLDVDFGSTYQTSYKARDVVDKQPIIVEGASPWNWINYTNAQKNAESIVNNTYVRSGLVNGTQWDTALAWIKKNTELEVGDTDVSTAWGNYNTSNITTLNRFAMYSTNYGGSWTSGTSKPANSKYLLRTGASTQTKSLNISDLAGNLYEWTNEILYNNSSVGVGRGFQFETGGLNSYKTRASYREFSPKTSNADVRSFRVALYIK